MRSKTIKTIWSFRRFIFAWSIPIVLLPIPLLFTTQAGKCAYVVLLMALYWLTEAMPLAITSLIPVVLFPVLGIMSSDHTCKAYVNGTIMVFLGSLIAAAAVQKSGLHQRIALRVILLFGTSPKRLLLGFMLNTAFLSMWVSNLAATALMIPIINASLDQLRQRKSNVSQFTDEQNVTIDFKEGHRFSIKTNFRQSQQILSEKNDQQTFQKVRKALFLGICYSANIGGTGTLTGTSTNLILNGILKENPISFSDWIIFNLPGMFLLIILSWLLIMILFMRNTNSFSTRSDKEVIDKAIRKRYEDLGHMTFYELSVLFLFIILLLLWFLRNPDFVKGWAPLINEQTNFIKDASPAIFVVLFFFLIPSHPTDLKSSPMLLDWKTTQESVSWNIVLLLGGGYAMAEGSELSGLSHLIGDQLNVLENLPTFLIIIIVCVIALIITEVASNSASCAMLLPVIKRMALTLGLNPLSVMLPVTLSCSYAFMLPVATGPNAIVFEAAQLKAEEMTIPGLILKLICLSVVIIMINTWGHFVFDLNTVNHAVNQTLTTMSQ